FGGKLERAFTHGGKFRFDGLAHLLDAETLYENLDPRLEEIVAAAELVVDAERRLEIGQELALRQERAERLGDHRRAAEATPHQHLEAHLARLAAPEIKPD